MTYIVLKALLNSNQPTSPSNGISIGSAIIAYVAAKAPNAFKLADNPKIAHSRRGIGASI